MKNLVMWLPKKDWSKLTEEEIKKFIDDLEDGVIKNSKGDITMNKINKIYSQIDEIKKLENYNLN